jgi:hypothetical protein
MLQNGEKDLEFIEALQRTGLQRFPVHWLHRQIKLFYGITQDRSVAGRLKGLAEKRFLEFDGGAFILNRNLEAPLSQPVGVRGVVNG